MEDWDARAWLDSQDAHTNEDIIEGVHAHLDAAQDRYDSGHTDKAEEYASRAGILLKMASSRYTDGWVEAATRLNGFYFRVAFDKRQNSA